MSSDTLTPNTQYLEQVMTKALLEDKDFVVTTCRVFEEGYFDSAELQKVFSFVGAYFQSHKEIPTREMILNSIPGESRNSVQSYLNEVNNLDIDIPRHRDWLMAQTDLYLRDKAIKDAIRRSVDIIDGQQNMNDIRTLVEQALCRTIDIDLGLDYFGDLGNRLQRMFTNDTQRCPSGFPVFDEFVNGGFPPKTLSVFVAKIHGFKSNVMANMIARQVMLGKNVALASLEMSEDMFAQRFDGIYSKLDINRFYFNQTLQRQLVERLRQIKQTPNRGQLFIKAFPTGKASVNDFRSWVRELKLRGTNLDVFFFDYLNLMSSTEVKKGDGSYAEVKSIAEETRAMGFEFNIPMISVSQLNRAGTFMSFEDVDFNSIAECLHVDTDVYKRVNGAYINTKIKDIEAGDIIKGSGGDVEVKRKFPIERKQVYKITTKSGKVIVCSGKHKFPTNNGEKSLETGLIIGDRLCTERNDNV